VLPPVKCLPSHCRLVAVGTMALSESFPLLFIPGSCILGIVFAVYLWKVVSKVQLVGGQNVVRSQNGREYLLVSGA
jgi:hypothetical protein